MKAIVYERYGPPDVLELREVDKPVVGDDQVLVRVHATSVNPVDWHTMTGTPYMVRMMAGLLKPKSEFLGVDFAGKVESAETSRSFNRATRFSAREMGRSPTMSLFAKSAEW
jgi:NADPH:quinone reductase-like Zn-dependent oxidoreductase